MLTAGKPVALARRVADTAATAFAERNRPTALIGSHDPAAVTKARSEGGPMLVGFHGGLVRHLPI